MAGLRTLASEARELAETCRAGRILVDGARVALVGPVNVGKSSLFNRLVGRTRALVSSQAGTTRDYVEARVVWDGVPITLIDTAGDRVAEPGTAEAIGISTPTAKRDWTFARAWLFRELARGE